MAYAMHIGGTGMQLRLHTPYWHLVFISSIFIGLSARAILPITAPFGYWRKEEWSTKGISVKINGVMGRGGVPKRMLSLITSGHVARQRV